MAKVISILLNDKPDYARTVLNALRKCDGIGNYLLLINVQQGSEEMLSMARKINFAKTKFIFQAKELGKSDRAYIAWKEGFKLSNFIIYLEDNIAPAWDCLQFMEYCQRVYGDNKEIFSVTAFNRSFCEPAYYWAISSRQDYTPGPIGIWNDRWEWIKNQWSPNPRRYSNHLKNKLIEHNLKEVFPLLSRSQYIVFHDKCSIQSREKKQTKYWSGNHNLSSGTYSEATPLVTAVMITGMHQARYSLAKIAINCFKHQTYPNKELLIINHGGESLSDPDNRVREIRVKKARYDTVGDLRNMGLQNANGEYLISWDDDDWHHPKRIEIQMDSRDKNSAVLLKNRIHYSFKNGCALYQKTPEGACATILHPKGVNFRYPSLRRGSDKAFVSKFENCITVENDPGLYIRFYHGLNLWSARHIMGPFAAPNKQNRLHLLVKHRLLLAKVLATYKEQGWEFCLTARVE
jgi:hypothetical protein